MPTPLHSRPASAERRGRRQPLLVGAVALVALLLAPVLGASSATAASPQAEAASTWLAGLVGPDGSVDSPYSGLPSLTWTANVALSLATTGNEPAALQRALDHLAANVDGYITGGTSDPAGRLGWLILLVDATGGDPAAFGGHDLVAELQGRYGVAEAGLYGAIDDFTPVTNQSIALLALTAAGASAPSAAIDWLVGQQCSAPASAAGAWEGYRAPSGPGLEPCEEAIPSNFASAESNSTALAVQALEAVGVTSPVAAALTWFHGIQDATPGPAIGGFGQKAVDPSDPSTGADANSTALVIQAIIASGGDPSASTWALGGGTPVSSLQSWILPSGADAGALRSYWSLGGADTFATYQGVWGLAEVAFPLPTPQPSAPTTTTTTAAPGPSTVAVGVEAVAVTPSFTG